MSDYISKSAFIEDIKSEIVNIAMNGLKGTPRSREELYQLIERIEEQPTVDEKEIIRKPMERAKAKLDEELMKIHKKRLRNTYSDEGLLEVRGFETGIRYAYICMREECGINE